MASAKRDQDGSKGLVHGTKESSKRKYGCGFAATSPTTREQDGERSFTWLCGLWFDRIVTDDRENEKNGSLDRSGLAVPAHTARILVRGAALAGSAIDAWLTQVLDRRRKRTLAPSKPADVRLVLSGHVVDGIESRAAQQNVTPSELVQAAVQEYARDEIETIKARHAVSGLVERGLEGVVALSIVAWLATDLSGTEFHSSSNPKKEPTQWTYPSPPMVKIAAGTFRIGCSSNDATCDGWERRGKDKIEVEVNDFFIDAYEVTVGDFKTCVEHGPCSWPEGHERQKCYFELADAERQPMNCVSHAQAERFCAFIGRRLPTDNEWEAAAAGPTSNTYAWGNQEPACFFEAFTYEPSERTPLIDNRPACSHPTAAGAHSRAMDSPNDVTPSGLYSMSGGLLEWVNGPYQPELQRNAGLPMTSKSLRGGRTYRRHGAAPSTQNEMIGFRCASRNPP